MTIIWEFSNIFTLATGIGFGDDSSVTFLGSPGVETTADSDRSRSPLPSRNRQEQPGQRQALPCFPRWCGPMGSAVRSLSMPRPQNVIELDYASTFPPTPPSMPPPPMFPASQTSLCPPTQACSPSQPGPISASQSKSTGTTRRSHFQLWHNRSSQSLWV